MQLASRHKQIRVTTSVVSDDFCCGHPFYRTGAACHWKFLWSRLLHVVTNPKRYHGCIVMAIDDKELSKTISYALRHDPGAYGLQLDQEGWVRVADLLQALRS